MTRVVVAICWAVVASTLGTIAVVVGVGQGRTSSATAKLADAALFTRFPTYGLGSSFEGLQLVNAEEVSFKSGVDTQNGRYGPPTSTVSYYRFIYGTCAPDAAERGCMPPLEIQIWPACRRSRALFANNRTNAPGILPDGAKEELVRGVPSLRLEGRASDPTMTEVYTIRAM